MAQTIALLVVGVLMYAILILPQQRRAKAHRELLDALDEGDEVVTSSGIYGFVNAVDGEVVWLEAAEGVEFKISKSAVASKVAAPSEGAAAASESDESQEDE